MHCPGCQTENRPTARFCRECRAPLVVVCQGCGATLQPGSKFCDACGSALNDPAAVPGQPRFASPDQYTPRHLAEKILTSREAVEGERKQVTVLFADLKGSMELLADRDPEDARTILDPVLQLMIDAVHRYDGTVNQVLGDGIMAIFGAPLALEDHALRAAYAALTMQASIRAHAEQRRHSGDVDIRIRVGLNSGEVLIRAIRNDLYMDYSAVGQTTHLASRMEQLARPGSILISVETKRLVEGYVQVEPLGPTSIKGLVDPVEVFELIGAEFSRTRLQVAGARGLTRFVGRQHELDVLTRLLKEVSGGQGQIVALVGEAGVGKSRLVWELVRSQAARGFLVLETRSVSYGRAAPYAPVRDLIARLFTIDVRDSAPVIRDKVTAKVASLDGTLEDTIAPVLALLGALPDASPFLLLDPPDRRQRTLDALKRLLLGESRIQPILVIFEDLHWIDSETQAFLDILVDGLPMARILLLVNYRPEYHHAWSTRGHYAQLRIDPLAPDTAEELLRAQLGNDPALISLKQLLIERTQRNPFFLEESIRTLAETQALVGAPGAYQLVKPLEIIRVPATVQAVLAARIDRLPTEEKLLLQIASVIGKDVPFELLRAIAGLPEAEVRSRLGRLQAAEFLYETSLFPQLEYTFKHALTHEVTYNGLLQERRRALHAAIVDAMERLPDERLMQQIERLAQHAFRGEVWDKAVRYLRRAGTKAGGQSAHRQAVAFFEQALTALGRLADSPAVLEQGIDVRFDLRNSLFALGDLDRILEYLHEATTLAETLGDRRRLGWVAAYMSHYFWRIGDHARAIESGRRALTIAEQIGDFGLQTTNVNVGLAYYAVGDYPRAVECLRKISMALGGERIRERFGWAALPAVTSRAYLVGCFAELGEFSEGIAVGEEAIRIAEAANHPFSLGQALLNLGVLYVRKGALDVATVLLQRGSGLGGLSNVSALSAAISAALGYAYARSGRLDTGLPLLEAGVAQAGTNRIAARHSVWTAWLAEAYLLAGRAEDAVAFAERALQLSRRHNERGNVGHALWLLGEIAATHGAGARQDAAAFYLEAIELASNLGMRPLVAQCRAGLGSWYRHLGRIADAEQQSRIADAMFESMGMARRVKE